MLSPPSRRSRITVAFVNWFMNWFRELPARSVSESAMDRGFFVFCFGRSLFVGRTLELVRQLLPFLSQQHSPFLSREKLDMETIHRLFGSEPSRSA